MSYTPGVTFIALTAPLFFSAILLLRSRISGLCTEKPRRCERTSLVHNTSPITNVYFAAKYYFIVTNRICQQRTRKKYAEIMPRPQQIIILCIRCLLYLCQSTSVQIKLLSVSQDKISSLITLYKSSPKSTMQLLIYRSCIISYKYFSCMFCLYWISKYLSQTDLYASRRLNHTGQILSCSKRSGTGG